MACPNGVAFDTSGNIYITDSANNRVRKVDSSGSISTVAGNGINGYSGDGGPATSAQLAGPIGVAFDNIGNMFVVAGGRIREVDTFGNISTVAGNGINGYSGDGGAATSAQLDGPHGLVFDSSGNMFIADMLNNRIRKVNTLGQISTVAGNGIQGYF